MKYYHYKSKANDPHEYISYAKNNEESMTPFLEKKGNFNKWRKRITHQGNIVSFKDLKYTSCFPVKIYNNKEEFLKDFFDVLLGL